MVRGHGRSRYRVAVRTVVGIGALLVVTMGALGTAAAMIGAAAVPAEAANGSYTWSGADAQNGTNLDWSDGQNWVGASAPSGTVGSIALPPLATCGASSANPCAADDDVSVATDSLAVSGSYLVDGQAGSGSTATLTVGSGGISATGGSQSVLALPLALSAPQTWTIGGGLLAVASPVSGSGPLSLALSGGGQVELGPGAASGSDDEVGPLSVAGASTADTGIEAPANGTLVLNAAPGTPVGLDDTDGATTTVTDAAVAGSATTGPLTLHGGLLAAGTDTSPAGGIHVAGSLALDATSAYRALIVGTGDTAGTDYPQVEVTGNASLGSAQLEVAMSAGGCTVPAAGTVYTLLTATGGVQGAFTSAGVSVPDGGTVPLGAAPGCPATGEQLVVTYGPDQVTATVQAGTSGTAGVPGSGTASTTTLTASATSVAEGAEVTYEATVAPVPASGTVTFDDNGASLPTCTDLPVNPQGTAACTVRYAVAGRHTVTATFGGGSEEQASTSRPVTVVVGAAGGGGGGGGAPRAGRRRVAPARHPAT